MSSKRPSLGKIEAQCLEWVANQKRPVSCRESYEHFKQEAGLARTTVQTMLERLTDKTYLVKRKIDGVQHYEAEESGSEILLRQVKSFIDERLGGRTSPLISFFSEDRRLKPEDKKALAAILEKLEVAEKDRK